MMIAAMLANPLPAQDAEEATSESVTPEQILAGGAVSFVTRLPVREAEHEHRISPMSSGSTVRVT
jgi:hypothetical protein